jgi:hypothetical protein
MKTILFSLGTMILAGTMAFSADVIREETVHEVGPGPVIEENEPGIVHETEEPTTRAQAKELREMWEHRAKHAATFDERAHANAMRKYYDELEHHLR